MEESQERTPEEVVREDIYKYLESLSLSFKDDTLKMVTDEETGEVKPVLDPDFAMKFKAFMNRYNKMEEDLKEFKNYAKDFLKENNWTKPVEANGVYILLQNDYKRTSLNSADIKEVLPNVFDLFSKTINVNGSAQIKVVDDTAYNPWDFLKNK